MKLSTSFTIDTNASWVVEHNAESRRIVSSWENGHPIRVPLVCDDTAIQHGLYAGEHGVDYYEYYTNPDEMVRVQLEAARYRREQPIYDFPLGVLPESWPIFVDFWPVPVQGWVGCDITYRSNGSPVQTPLSLNRRECLALEMPDPKTGGFLKKITEFSDYIRENWVGREFLGRPIGPVYSGVDHNGVFSLALDIRGKDLLTDFYEDPDFVRRFLLKVAGWCDAFERAWPDAFPGRPAYFRNTDHGIDLLSSAMYSDHIYPVVAEINRRRGTQLPTSWHYCGGGIHLLETFKEHYPIERIDDLTYPLLDPSQARCIVGEDVWIKAALSDGIVHAGPPDRIRETVRQIAAAESKGRGRFCLSVGDMLPGTELEHRLALYKAVKEYGVY